MSCKSRSLSFRHFAARRHPAFARYSLIHSVASHKSSIVTACEISEINPCTHFLSYYFGNSDILNKVETFLENSLQLSV